MAGETTTAAIIPDRTTVELCIHILRGNLGAGRGREALQQRDDDISILETLLTPADLRPANPSALAQSIAEIEAWERSGEHLGEIENEVALSESICLCLSELKRLRTLPLWPAQLTPVLREVLGLMCFQLAPAAHVYQAAGEFVDGDGAALKRRAEDEQAFMLHKIVGIALEHGEKWDGFVQADINRAMAIVEARRSGRPA